ncbi:MAG: DMT family transporter [Promethearchaeati archaeon]
MKRIYLQLTLMILIWGFSFIMVDIGVDYITPLSLALYRFIISSIAFIFIRVFNYLKSPKESLGKDLIMNQKISVPDWIFLIIASFSGVSLFFFTQYSSIQIIGPSLPALFVCLLAPVIITTLALIFFDERLNKLKIIGFIIATFGGFLLVTGGDINVLNPETATFFGYFYAILTPFLWAFYSIISKQLTKKLETMKFLEIITYLGTFELFLIVLFTNQFPILFMNLFRIELFLSVLYLGLFCHIIGYFIWTDSQHKINSSKAASFLYIEPFVTLLFSFLLQREETILILNILGGIIVLIAVLIINYE